MEKQIEEMAKVIDEFTEPLSARDIHKADFSEKFAKHLYNAGCRKQSEGEWKSHSEFNIILHADIHLGYICSRCNKGADYNTNFCPNCGAKMKGENDGKAD